MSEPTCLDQIIQRINAFSRKARLDQHTDTGEVWELLEAIKRDVRAAKREKIVAPRNPVRPLEYASVEIDKKVSQKALMASSPRFKADSLGQVIATVRFEPKDDDHVATIAQFHREGNRWICFGIGRADQSDWDRLPERSTEVCAQCGFKIAVFGDPTNLDVALSDGGPCPNCNRRSRKIERRK